MAFQHWSPRGGGLGRRAVHCCCTHQGPLPARVREPIHLPSFHYASQRQEGSADSWSQGGYFLVSVASSGLLSSLVTEKGCNSMVENPLPGEAWTVCPAAFAGWPPLCQTSWDGSLLHVIIVICDIASINLGAFAKFCTVSRAVQVWPIITG